MKKNFHIVRFHFIFSDEQMLIFFPQLSLFHFFFFVYFCKHFFRSFFCVHFIGFHKTENTWAYLRWRDLNINKVHDLHGLKFLWRLNILIHCAHLYFISEYFVSSCIVMSLINIWIRWLCDIELRYITWWKTEAKIKHFKIQLITVLSRYT